MFYGAYGSYLELNRTVLVIYFLHLLSFSAKGSSISLPSFYAKMRLKQATLIMIETTYGECFLARPIDDEDEHSRNDGWECF